MAVRENLNGYLSFTNADDYLRWYEEHASRIKKLDAWFGDQEFVNGYCDCCHEVTRLKIESGAKFGSAHNLREGFICSKNINSRSRLVLRVFNSLSKEIKHMDVALFEDFTRLAQSILEVNQKISSSIYIGGDHVSGEKVEINGLSSTMQDMTNTSYDDCQFDAVIHCDVLEHIPDHKAALKDNFRILKNNGQLIFTAPFFPLTPKSVPLASLDKHGNICHHIDPPEYHGDNISGAVLSFWRFSWDLLNTMEDIGYKDCRVLVELDPFSGFVSNNCSQSAGNMTSIVVTGTK